MVEQRLVKMADVYNSKVAKLLAKIMKKQGMALVIGQTVYYSMSEAEVGPRLRRHENRHKQQYKENGFFKFIFLYIFYTIKYGYRNNPFEVDARNHELP